MKKNRRAALGAEQMHCKLIYDHDDTSYHAYDRNIAYPIPAGIPGIPYINIRSIRSCMRSVNLKLLRSQQGSHMWD